MSTLCEREGICTECKEHARVCDPCCNAPVFSEGSYLSWEDCEKCNPEEAA